MELAVPVESLRTASPDDELAAVVIARHNAAPATSSCCRTGRVIGIVSPTTPAGEAAQLLRPRLLTHSLHHAVRLALGLASSNPRDALVRALAAGHADLDLGAAVAEVPRGTDERHALLRRITLELDDLAPIEERLPGVGRISSSWANRRDVHAALEPHLVAVDASVRVLEVGLAFSR